MSSTLEVMKDFFMSSGFNLQRNGRGKSSRGGGATPKKCQGGGDRGMLASIVESGSETTVYCNALTQEMLVDEVDPEISFKRRLHSIPPGKSVFNIVNQTSGSPNKHQGGAYLDTTQSTVVDENYLMVGSHIDDSIKDKIKRGEFIDLAKLLPKDQSVDDDHRMELVFKGGQTYFMPVSERENTANAITNYHKWEQAFRVYSNIYLEANPGRALELIQYSHIICTASAAYIWDNVYTYDKEFRGHLSRFPERKWSQILQQAWTMFLKDRLKPGDSNYYSRGNSSNEKKKKDTCKRFNRGKMYLRLRL